MSAGVDMFCAIGVSYMVEEISGLGKMWNVIKLKTDIGWDIHSVSKYSCRQEYGFRAIKSSDIARRCFMLSNQL